MNVADFLNRLEHVRKTKDGWMATCPAHADKDPSLSVGVGDEGQILLRCFAGCTVDSVVEALGLGIASLFPNVTPAIRGVQPASGVPPIADWLRNARGLSADEVSRMFGQETGRGVAVVFRYRDAQGRLLYDKFRSLSEKRFWRKPTGTESALYGLWTLNESADERVIVVEGEIDAHALWSVGNWAVVSVPDGAGSNLKDDRLAALGPFRVVILATDADGPGDMLAARLAGLLGVERCRRCRLVTPGGGKDANDALRAGWSREQFEEAFAAAPAADTHVAPSTTASADAADQPEPSGESLSRRYQVIENRICYIHTDRKGNQLVECLSHFAAQVDEEITFDDGTEVRREFRISGRLATGEILPTARVGAAEFAALTWVTREWGIQAVVAAGQGTKDHLRTAIQHLSKAKRRRIFRHTGWIEHGGKPAFLYQGGAVGADGLEVELPPPLDRFRLPDRAVDVPEAIRWSLRFLDAGPIEVTAPLLASVYLAPVSSILNPDVTVWLHGASGSLKSTLSAIAQQHFGDFDRKTLSATWTSTENSLENRLNVLKDVLSVIDDYAPQADPRAQHELDRRVQRVLRNVGNRAGRGRLMADLTQRPDRPPRGFLLCNGEELPPGLSINARLVPVEVVRKTLDLGVITALQENGDRLRHAMRGYIAFLAPQLASLRVELPRAREEMRRELQAGTTHLRQPEAVANLYVGIDLFLSFAESEGALSGSAADELRGRIADALRFLSTRQARSLADTHPAEVFIDVLGTLLTQRKVKFLEANETPSPLDAEMIGWRRGDLALVLPDAAYRRVALFIRETGEHWAPSPHELHKELVDRGYLVSTTDGRDAGQWRVGAEGKKKRGWLLRLAVLNGACGGGAGNGASHGAPDGLPAIGGLGTEAEAAKQLELDGKFNGHARVPPMPPYSEGIEGTRGGEE